MVSNEQKAITKKRTTWFTEFCTSLKGIVSQRLLALTASFALVAEGFFLQLPYMYCNLTHIETSMAKTIQFGVQ